MFRDQSFWKADSVPKFEPWIRDVVMMAGGIDMDMERWRLDGVSEHHLAWQIYPWIGVSSSR